MFGVDNMPEDGKPVNFVYISASDYCRLDDKDPNTIYFVYSSDEDKEVDENET